MTMPPLLRYLAYGSNLHPLRIALRVNSAVLVGVARLQGYRLTFHKRSDDGSAKCNLLYTAKLSDEAYGAVFSLQPSDKPFLDAAEGLGKGYLEQQLSVAVGDSTLPVFAYFAAQSHLVKRTKPYDWYKRMVLAGARKHAFPADFIASIERVPSKHDRNAARRLENENLLVQLEG